MRTIWNDVRYGLRMLAAAPGFTAVAVLSIAIGIGANTSMFSLVDAFMLRPLPVPHSSRIVHVASTSRSDRFGRISYPDYVDFRNQASSVSGLLAYQQIPVGFNADPRSPARLKLGIAVSTNFFDALEVRPAMGRAFRPEEDRTPVAVISDFLWQSEFGRDPSVIGRSISLSKTNFTIIGVAPESFTGLNLFFHEEFYVPLGVLPQLAPEETKRRQQRDRLSLDVFARLAPGRTAPQAQAEFQAIARRLEEVHPDTNRGRSVLVMPEMQARSFVSPDNALEEGILLAIAIAVLLIACANVANLLLARGRARSREIAIRLAIGASRKRLFQQLLTESLLLAMLGGAAGLLLALFSIDFFASVRLPTTLPIWLVARPDPRVLLFACAATLVSGLIFGVAPALHALRSDVNSTLKAGDAAPPLKRWRFHGRDALAAAQIGLSMLLLVTSGLLVKDFSRMTAARAGFRVDHVLVMGLNPLVAHYSESQARTFYRQLLDRVRSLPGVSSATLAEHVPLGFSSSSREVAVEGFQMPPGQRSVTVSSDIVGDHYFSLMHIPLVQGRAFESTETGSSPLVAIVNEAMAQTYWPNRNPLGGRIRLADNQVLEVVGVAKTIKYHDPAEPPLPFLYMPFAQQYSSFMMLHVETPGDPAALAAPVLAQVHSLDPGMPVVDTQTLEHFFNQAALWSSRLVTQVVVAIGLLGLLLAVTGLYGVIAYSVSRRTREIGIRMAIGADAGNVARLVLRQGLWLTLIGTAIGLALALAVSKLLASLLAGVSSRDPAVYLLAPALLAAVSLLACYVPARRAARVDPMEALRHD